MAQHHTHIQTFNLIYPHSPADSSTSSRAFSGSESEGIGSFDTTEENEVCSRALYPGFFLEEENEIFFCFCPENVVQENVVQEKRGASIFS